MKTKCQYNHDACNTIDLQGGAQGGAGVLILLDEEYILLGYDNYWKMYALCTGKRRIKETCYIEAIEREVLEEFKLNISSLQDTNTNVFCERNEHFLNETEDPNFIVVNKTPIFIGKYNTRDISITKLNKKIETDNNNDDLPKDYKEIDHVKVFLRESIKKTKDGNYKIKNSNGYTYQITKFTYDVLSSFNKKFNKPCLERKRSVKFDNFEIISQVN